MTLENNNTDLRYPWQRHLHVLWIAIAVLTLGLIIAGASPRYGELLQACSGSRCAEEQLTAQQVAGFTRLGLSPPTYALVVVVLEMIVALGCVLAGSVIVWRRPNEWMALFVAIFLSTLGLAQGEFMEALGSSRALERAQMDALEGLFGWSQLLLFFYLFPNGHFSPPWGRTLAFGWAGLWLLAFLMPDSALNMRYWPPWLQLLVVTVVLWVPGVVAQVYRYLHVSTPTERQQTKWVVVGVSGTMLLLGAALALSPDVRGGATPADLALALTAIAVSNLAILLIPLAIGLAVLRFGLWDIDPIVNRALVYSILTGTIALLYFGSVTLLQVVFRTITGQESQLAIVMSTLGIAVLFSPLRHLIQDSVDRRFYRRKYDAAQTLARFATAARDEVDINQLTAELLAVVEESVQPEEVSLWLKKTELLIQRGH